MGFEDDRIITRREEEMLRLQRSLWALRKATSIHARFRTPVRDQVRETYVIAAIEQIPRSDGLSDWTVRPGITLVKASMKLEPILSRLGLASNSLSPDELLTPEETNYAIPALYDIVSALRQGPKRISVRLIKIPTARQIRRNTVAAAQRWVNLGR